MKGFSVKKQGFFLVLLLLFALSVMLLPKTAVAGAKDGLMLWFQTVLPTLLPFMILSNLLLETNVLAPICRALKVCFGRLFHISENGVFALLLGFFCGFPMGAKILSDLRIKKRISRAEAQYLLGFCNNFSPMFLLGYVKELFPRIPTWNLLLVIFGSPLLFGLISRKKGTDALFYEIARPNKCSFSFSMVDESIMSGFFAITKIGGYLILFGIFAKMVTVLSTVTTLKAFLLALTEITTGVHFISFAGLPTLVKECLALPGLCFGGLSGLAQTKSMLTESALSIRRYFYDRLKIALIALFLTIVCFFIRNLPV